MSAFASHAWYLMRPIVVALALAVCAWRAGSWTLARARLESPRERLVLALALGYAELGLAAFLVGLAHGLHRAALAVAAAALIAAAAPSLGRGARSLVRDAGRAHAAFALAAAAVLALGFCALYPATAFDATMYHLALAKTYTLGHHVAPVDWLRYPVFPQLDELLFTLVLPFGDDRAAHLVQFSLLLVTAATIFVWGASWFSPRAGALAAAVWLGSPFTLFLGSTGYVDGGLACFVTAGLFAVARWTDERDRARLSIGGALLGAAAACKYLGLTYLLLAGVWISIIAIKQKRWSAPFQFALAALAMALPFYAYITWYSHNPVFPFGARWFGYSYWSESDVNGQRREMTSWGGGTSFLELITVLRNIAVMPRRFHCEAPITAAYYRLIPFALGVSFWNARARVLTFIALPILLYWFYTIQIARYLSPVFPVLALACAASLLAVVEKIPRAGPRLARWPLTVVLAIGCVYPTYGWAWLQRVVRGPIPKSIDERDDYLSKYAVPYSLIERLNESGRPYRVHGFDTEFTAYYWDGAYLGDHFGRYSYSKIVPLFAEPRRLFVYLKSLNVDHLIVRLTFFPYAREPEFQRYFQAEASVGGYALFRLVPDSVR